MKLSFKKKPNRAQTFDMEAENAQRDLSKGSGNKLDFSKIKLPKIKLPKIKVPYINTKAVLYALIILAVIVAAAVMIFSTISEGHKEKIPSPTDIIDKTGSEESDIQYDAPTMKKGFTYNYHRFSTNELTAYEGDVKILSFHALIAYADRAFSGNSKASSTDDRCLTPSEFQKILQSLYDNGYILVNLNDVYEDGENGNFEKCKLSLPKDRKPLVLIFDDMCFYESQQECGTIEKIAINKDGLIRGLSTSKNGRTTYSRDADPVSILDMFVEDHPDFSFGGAKGCIVLTGYNGILGYRTQSDFAETEETNRQRELAYAKPVIQLLKKTGWYFACGTYGDIDIVSAEYTAAVEDMAKWVNEVGLLVGETKIFVYPQHSVRETTAILTSGDTYEYLQNLGFKYFVAAGDASSIETDESGLSAICRSLSVSGFSLRWSSDKLTDYFIVSNIFDAETRPGLGSNFPVQSSDKQGAAPTGTGNS